MPAAISRRARQAALPHDRPYIDSEVVRLGWLPSFTIPANLTADGDAVMAGCGRAFRGAAVLFRYLAGSFYRPRESPGTFLPLAGFPLTMNFKQVDITAGRGDRRARFNPLMMH